MTRAPHPRRLHWTWIVLLAMTGAVFGFWAAPAGAHALAQRSDPPAGATLSQPPAAVTVWFGETPDPKLSRLRVLDASSTDRARGPVGAVAGQPLALRVSVGPLGTGVYTVAWRTVSIVDGHLASGTFAFGVGVAPQGAAATSALASSFARPQADVVAARWTLYGGLMLLVGTAVIALRCYPDVPRRASTTQLTAVGASLTGATAIAILQARTAQVGFDRIWTSPFGHQWLARAGPVGAAVVALTIAISAGRAHQPQLQKAMIAVTGTAGLVAMWGDVGASHVSAASGWRLVRMLVQVAHFAAAGIWVGGLVALLVTITTVPPAERMRAARRYSALALGAVAVLTASGVQRAIDEVGTLHALAATGFGQSVLVKSGLLLSLLALGALNRYRHVPAIADSVRPLRRVARVELLLMAGVLAATGVLQGLAPPATVGASIPPTFELSGHDFATSVRVRLSISPGAAGFNDFVLQAQDYDSGQPIAGAAAIRFRFPARPDLGTSTLALSAAGPGKYTGRAASLSLAGTWDITVTMQLPSGGIEIPLVFATHEPPPHLVVEHSPGLPDVFTLERPDGRKIQTYLDPGHPGMNEFHATFLGPDGSELAITDATVKAADQDGTPGVALTVRRLDPLGHFVADLPNAGRSRYRFTVTGTPATGTDPAGDQLQGTFTIPVG